MSFIPLRVTFTCKSTEGLMCSTFLGLIICDTGVKRQFRFLDLTPFQHTWIKKTDNLVSQQPTSAES